jgi:rhomboid family protein
LFFAVPAAVYLLVWFGMQFLSGTAALLGPEAVGGVAWWAHIGGFVAGAAFVGLFLDPSRQRRFYRDELGYRSAWGHFG